MLIYSMSLSADGYINDRDGKIDWTAPSDELFAFHLARVRELGLHLSGRRLYETMLPWEHDASMRDNPDTNEFADVWTALPKVVFSRTLTRVQGNARLAEGTVAEEVARALDSTDKDVEIGGAALAAEAVELDLIDEYRLFRGPVILGGGTPFFPPLQDKLELELVEIRTFAPQTIYERYRRVGR